MERFQIVDIICTIDWKESKEIIDKEFQDCPKAEGSYNAEIRYNLIKPAPLELYIYYPQDNFLFEKFDFLKKKSINILSYIQIPSTEYAINDEQLDFSNSEVLDIFEGNREWVHRKKTVIIRINNLAHYTSSSHTNAGFFFLTENACNPIHLLSHYWKVVEDEFCFSNSPVHTGTYNNTYDWGPMSFGIGFKHSINDLSKHIVSLERIPYLLIDAKIEYTDLQIVDYANKLCLIMSLFYSKYINYYWGRIRVTKEQRGQNIREKTEYKFIEDQIDDNEHDTWADQFEDLFKFLKAIDYKKVAECNDLLTEITNRLIKSQYVDEISEFMLLYNVIEKIRNYYLSLGLENGGFSIKEEYDFETSKTRTDKFIKKCILEVSSIVADYDKEDFEKNASNKITFIRKTGLTDQFSSLVTFLRLSINNYNIDFKKLINIRNSLYHGNRADENYPLYNKEMRKLINHILVKLLCKN